MITLFSAPKPFVDEHIARIQRNAIRSWIALGDDVQVLLLGEEPGLKEAAEALGVSVLPVRTRSASGAPLIDELFTLASEKASHSILAYLNADIVLLDDFMSAVKLVDTQFDQFLIVGNRWDIDFRDELEFESGWLANMRALLTKHARKHPSMGSDYFIFRKDQFQGIPRFVLGRAGWDNWMMYKARHEGWPLIDATEAITAIHQDHDYAHLPGGLPHYRHPESSHNITLAGGYEAMFRLQDADWVLAENSVRRKRPSEWSWPRKIEADLLAGFGTGNLAKFTRMIFHPGAAIRYLQQKLRSKGEVSLGWSRDSEDSK